MRVKFSLNWDYCFFKQIRAIGVCILDYILHKFIQAHHLSHSIPSIHYNKLTIFQYHPCALWLLKCGTKALVGFQKIFYAIVILNVCPLIRSIKYG